jgi:hypothetical protein
MNLSYKAETQYVMPVFVIDTASIAIYRSAYKSRTLANKEHHCRCVCGPLTPGEGC